MPAHAEDTTLPWTACQDITPTEKDGNYTFTTIGKSWVFPRVQLKETVGKLMGTADQVTLEFSFSLTAPEDATIRPLIRATAVADAPKFDYTNETTRAESVKAFNAWYKPQDDKSGISMSAARSTRTI